MTRAAPSETNGSAGRRMETERDLCRRDGGEGPRERRDALAVAEASGARCGNRDSTGFVSSGPVGVEGNRVPETSAAARSLDVGCEERDADLDSRGVLCGGVGVPTGDCGEGMLTLSPAVRVFLAWGVTDMRRSVDGLSALVTSSMELDPFWGASSCSGTGVGTG